MTPVCGAVSPRQTRVVVAKHMFGASTPAFGAPAAGATTGFAFGGAAPAAPASTGGFAFGAAAPAAAGTCSALVRLCVCRSEVCIVRPLHHTRRVPCAALLRPLVSPSSSRDPRVCTFPLPGHAGLNLGPTACRLPRFSSAPHADAPLPDVALPLLQPQGLEQRQRLQPRPPAPSTSARLPPPPPRRPPSEVSPPRTRRLIWAGVDTGGEEGCREGTMQCSIHEVDDCGSRLRPPHAR